MKGAKQIISEIRGAFIRHQAAMNAILSGYQRDVENAKREAAKYKDEAATLAESKTKLLTSARMNVLEVDKEFHDEITLRLLPRLKAALSEYITARPSRDYMDSLRDVKDFRLTMSRSELQGYITAAEGNFTALRALQSVAKGCGYMLTIPGVESFQTDVDAIEKAVRTPMMYAADYLHEGLEVMPDRPVFRPDGSVGGYGGRPDSAYLIVRQQEFKSLLGKLDEMSERWEADFVPSLGEFAELESDDGEIISPEVQRAEKLKAASERVQIKDMRAVENAAQTGRQQAEADRKAAEGLAHYF